MNTPETPPAKPAYCRETVIAELEHRRKKQWDIFSWTSTLLTAITGGVIALKTGEHPNHFGCAQQAILSVAVLTLFGYAARWVDHNISLEDASKLALQELNEKLVTHPQPKIGYVAALALLAAAAIAAIWISALPRPKPPAHRRAEERFADAAGTR
jgi:membrane protein YdbS with pleckstrin-like domain